MEPGAETPEFLLTRLGEARPCIESDSGHILEVVGNVSAWDLQMGYLN